MKKLLILAVLFAAVFQSHAQPQTGNEILAFVRSRLPADPLKLTGSLKVKAKNGYTKANLPVEMELHWGAANPSATYRIGEPGTKQYQDLTIIWQNGTPTYAFSDPLQKPTSTILGTGITWADLSFAVFWWPNAKLTGETTKINRECHIIEVPVPNTDQSMRLWIEKNMGMLLEAQTLDAKGNELNRLRIISIQKMEEMWVAKDLELRDKKTGAKTTLQISDLEWLEPEPMEAPAEAFNPAEAVNQLAFDLYHQLATEEKENLFFSPYSISTALAMTYAGARGETAEQMNTTLHFGGQIVTHPAFAYLRTALDRIQKKENIQLNVANALWPQKDLEFRTEFIDLTQKHYASELHPVNYPTDSEGARNQINQWVEKQTHEKIKDLIGEADLNALTRLVLVNAIYFKGNWAAQFDPKQTHDATFHLPDASEQQVPMMSKKANYNLAEGDGFKALEIPYEGDDLSMLIFLPNPTNTLSALEKNLSSTTIDGLQFNKEELIAQLPKFKLETSFALGSTLSKLGMPLAFNDQLADFSGMDEKQRLYISKALHKAFIEVNEEGTEAAAATAVVMKLESVQASPKIFRADRPFLFAIRENTSGTILFLGRVMNPETNS